MKAKGILLLSAVCFVLMLGGCGTKDVTSYDQNTLTIGKDGTIKEVSVENFADGNYNMQELEQFVSSEISTYNQTAGGERITLVELNTDNKLAKLQLNYASMEDYNQFNRKDYSLQSFADSALSGSLADVSGQTEVAVSEIEDKGYQVLKVSDAMELAFEGKPLYYNSYVTVSNGVYSSNGEGVAVVVFK